MPKRKRRIRIDTPDLQGEDSWVEFLKVNGEDGIRLLEIQQGLVASDNDRTILLESIRETSSMVLKYLVDWNWVDDDDRPLKRPAEYEDLTRILSYEEIMGLSYAMRNSRLGSDDSKN